MGSEIVKKGIYKHYKWYITYNTGGDMSWYCAYIQLPVHYIFYDAQCDLNLDVHGGITYTGFSSRFDGHEHYYVGWDYNHYGDWFIEWNTNMIESECMSAIEQLYFLDKSLIKIYDDA